jgi:hypothetical protein
MADLGGKSIGGEFTPLWAGETGVKTSLKIDADGTMHFLKEQMLAPVFDATQAMRNHNDGWNAARDTRRVAHLPQIWIEHCRAIEGWDPLNPENHDRLARVLNDSDYAYLRTAPGCVGYSNGVMR